MAIRRASKGHLALVREQRPGHAQRMITFIVVAWLVLAVLFVLGLCRAAAVGDRHPRLG